jgi:hypothetical protein
MTPEQLEAIEGIGPKTVEKISLAVNNYFASLESGAAVEGEAAPEGELAAEASAAVARGNYRGNPGAKKRLPANPRWKPAAKLARRRERRASREFGEPSAPEADSASETRE